MNGAPSFRATQAGGGDWSRGEGNRLGNLDFRSPTSAYYREAIEYPFFAHHLDGGPAGALHLSIALRPHRLFRPEGHDLYLDLPLAPWEAVLGASVEIPTLEGKVRLRIPAGAGAGQKFRLAGRGLPHPRGGAGDLCAVVRIVTPGQASARERELYEALARDSTFDPRAKLE